MIRNKQDQSIHSMLVRRTISWLKKEGYKNFLADLAIYRKNPKLLLRVVGPNIIRHRPDIACQDSRGNWLIAEIETCESLTKDHTRSQWRMFDYHAKKNGWKFLIAIPDTCEVIRTSKLLRADPMVRKLLKEYGINCDTILSIE